VNWTRPDKSGTRYSRNPQGFRIHRTDTKNWFDLYGPEGFLVSGTFFKMKAHALTVAREKGRGQ
jgi:hypothetical protein